jgi:hypothetical protein
VAVPREPAQVMGADRTLEGLAELRVEAPDGR